jgi:hypothetical protein
MRGSALSLQRAAADVFESSRMTREDPTGAVRASQTRAIRTRRCRASALLAALLASTVTLATAPDGAATGDGKPAAAAPKPSHKSGPAGSMPRVSPYSTFRKQHAAAESAAKPAANGVAVEHAAATPVSRPRKPAGQGQRSQ